MADGKTHFRAALAVDVAVAVATAAAISTPGFEPVAAGAMSGAMWGTYCTPDADLVGRTTPENVLFKIPLIGYAFHLFWLPYGAYSKHRGRSHSAIGTLMRAGYALAVPGMLFLVIFGAIGLFAGSLGAPVPVSPRQETVFFCVWFFWAWSLQDFVHYVFDGLLKGKRRASILTGLAFATAIAFFCLPWS